MTNEPTVKCPNCESDVEELATGFYHCPSCGAIFGDAVDAAADAGRPQTKQPGTFDFSDFVNKTLRKSPFLVVLVVVVVGVVIGLVSMFTSTDSGEDGGEPPPEPRVAEKRVEVNEPYVVAAPDGIILYTEPDLWSARVSVIPKDEAVTVTEKREYWWLVVRADSSAGWALSRLEDFGEVGTEPSAGETTE